MQLSSLVRPAAVAIRGGQGTKLWHLFGIAASTFSLYRRGALGVRGALRISGALGVSSVRRISRTFATPACTVPANGASIFFRGRFPSAQSRRTFISSSTGVRGMSTSSEQPTASSTGVRDLKTAQDVLEFWFGDEARLETEEEYLQTRSAKWFGFGPPDESFNNTQIAAKGLINQAANWTTEAFSGVRTADIDTALNSSSSMPRPYRKSDELVGEEWEGPKGALAKVLVLDQFSRTAYRGTAEAFGTDEKAAKLAKEVINKGWDTSGEYTPLHRSFLYMPLMHSEDLSAQDLCVKKCRELYEEEVAAQGSAIPGQVDFAISHRDVIAKFGRFPHRNVLLGRESTPEEEEWLKADDLPGWAKSQQKTSS